MQLEMILSEFGQKQFLQVWTNLWNWKYTYAAGNNLSQFAPMEILLCCWKRFYASLDKYVRQEMLL